MSKRIYTTQLQAGLGLLNETYTLLKLWTPDMLPSDLEVLALETGIFSQLSARRIKNIVREAFKSRYLSDHPEPAQHLKILIDYWPNRWIYQLFFLYTCRKNDILRDFVTQVYWPRYASGHTEIDNQDAYQFVEQSVQRGLTNTYWSDGTQRRVASYLTGVCIDFGLLTSKSRTCREIRPFQISEAVILYILYDLHFQGLADNQAILSEDWQLFGLDASDLRHEIQRLALKEHLIYQAAGDVVKVYWHFKSWEDLYGVLIKL